MECDLTEKISAWSRFCMFFHTVCIQVIYIEQSISRKNHPSSSKTLNELTLLDFTIFVCILFMSIPFTLFLSFNRIWDSTHYRKSKFLEFQRESGQFSIFIWDKVSLPESCKNWDFFICFCFYFEWVRVR